uniref:hypothetical protein n=1 Tax=Fortiea sp. LEGE XX443 TaxID=1828611 RepID=UPI00187EC5BB
MQPLPKLQPLLIPNDVENQLSNLGLDSYHVPKYYRYAARHGLNMFLVQLGFPLL